MTEAPAKPIATIRERTKWKTLNLPNATTGLIEKQRVSAGKETVRESFCFLHNKKTNRFAGVNESGWVFFCGAELKPNEEGHLDEPAGHYFISQAPEQATKPARRRKEAT